MQNMKELTANEVRVRLEYGLLLPEISWDASVKQIQKTLRFGENVLFLFSSFCLHWSF